jgi:hypothetical protein
MPKPYVEECAGGCHIAYPPNLLPARAWQNIMRDLERHYGTDASLDDAELARMLDAWLRANAAMGRRASVMPQEDRITKTPWYERKHRKIDAAVWRLESVKSAANCEACHGGADKGIFDEHDLIVPEGVSAAQARAFSKKKGRGGGRGGRGHDRGKGYGHGVFW